MFNLDDLRRRLPSFNLPPPPALVPVVPVTDPRSFIPFAPKESPPRPTIASYSNAAAAEAFLGTGASILANVAAAVAPGATATPGQRKIYMLADLAITPALTNNTQGFVSYAYTGSRFHVSPVVTVPAELLQDKIAAAVAQNSLKKLEGQVPIVGEVLLGKYQGGDYYRGVITKVDEGKGEVGLEFIDFGDTATSKFDELYVPTEEMMKEPVYGVVLSMFGIPEDTPMTTRILAIINTDSYSISFLRGEVKYNSVGILSRFDGVCLNSIILNAVMRARV